MISQTAEYALRAAVLLGSSPSRPRPAHEISEVTRIPSSYLAKILGALARAGLVSSQRGPRGGFALARDPSAVTLLDVITAVEPWRGLDRCPLGLPAHEGKLCPLHRRLAEAHRNLEEVFRGSTLHDLLATNDRDDGPFPVRPSP